MRVRDGRVLKKNNWVPDHKDYYARRQSEIQIERTHPGPGYRHVVTVAQLRRFLEILPDWDELAVGLEAISIWRGSRRWFGWCNPGVVVIMAWPREMWTWVRVSWAAEISDLLELLEVQVVADDEEEVADDVVGVRIAGQLVRSSYVELRWTEAQARGFMLLDVLVHELGHHHDRMTTRGNDIPRGEPYANAYAQRVRTEIWPEYTRRFRI
jgi:hypothetical protein